MKWIKKANYSTNFPFLPKDCTLGKFKCFCYGGSGFTCPDDTPPQKY